MISIKIDPNDIAKRISRMQSALPERLEIERRRLTKLIMQAIKQETPVRTGALKGSLKWVSVGKTDVLWGLYYGEYVITGTRPHVILPKKAKALRFEINGQIIFVTKVNHPGTKPNDFRQKGLDQMDYRPILNSLSSWLKVQVRTK